MHSLYPGKSILAWAHFPWNMVWSLTIFSDVWLISKWREKRGGRKFFPSFITPFLSLLMCSQSGKKIALYLQVMFSVSLSIFIFIPNFYFLLFFPPWLFFSSAVFFFLIQGFVLLYIFYSVPQHFNAQSPCVSQSTRFWKLCILRPQAHLLSLEAQLLIPSNEPVGHSCRFPVLWSLADYIAFPDSYYHREHGKSYMNS